MSYEKYKEIFNKVIDKKKKGNIKLDGYQINKYDIIFGINDRKLGYYCRSDKKEYDELKNYCVLWEKNIKFENNDNNSNKYIEILGKEDEILRNRELKYIMLKNKTKKIKEMIDSLGNYIFLPVQLSNSTSFYKHLRNQFDLYLKEIQTFYKNNYKYKIEDYISLRLYRELKENQDYFELFENFENFIIENCLEDYIDEDGNVKSLFEREGDEILPKSFKQILEYINNLEMLITKRTKRIEELLLQYTNSEIIENDYRNKVNIVGEYSRNLLNQQEKLYVFVSEEKEDVSTAIESLFKSESNIINVLKNAKEILIDIVVGDRFEEKGKKEYSKEDFKYLEKYTTINYDVIKRIDSYFVNKLKVMITITS